MDPIDREVIALRNFERLSSIEAAQVLGITESALRRRYLRALAALKGAILDVQKGRERTRG
jgi:RNA polymerase sigma-70 factor (ECF subfamily)